MPPPTPVNMPRVMTPTMSTMRGTDRGQRTVQRKRKRSTRSKTNTTGFSGHGKGLPHHDRATAGSCDRVIVGVTVESRFPRTPVMDDSWNRLSTPRS